VNELLTYGVISGLFIVAYIQHVIMLIELQKVLRQELRCLCSETTIVLSE